MSIQECVTRARNLNQQAIQDQKSGHEDWARRCRQERDFFIESARVIKTYR
jgi:hypothetical protein